MDPGEIVMRLHANWGHASAQQLKRGSAGSGGDNMHLLTCVDVVLEQCEVRMASAKTPDVPIAGASTPSMIPEKFQADLLFLGANVALRAAAVFSR